MSVLQDVKNAVAVIANEYPADENAIIDRLMILGYSKLRAELLLGFVPLGLARPVVARLPGFQAVLSNVALIRNTTTKEDVEVILERVAEFHVARLLGEETFSTGVIPRDHFTRVCELSAELRLISDALYRGDTVTEIYPPVLFGLATVVGFREWYNSVMAKA